MISRRLRIKRANGNAYVVQLAQLRHDTAAMKHSVGHRVSEVLITADMAKWDASIAKLSAALAMTGRPR